MQTLTYTPKGVCSRQIIIEHEGGKVVSLKVIGGCNGNLQGISHLVEGMEIKEVIRRLDGIKCGMKQTSCPDQIAQALKTISE